MMTNQLFTPQLKFVGYKIMPLQRNPKKIILKKTTCNFGAKLGLSNETKKSIYKQKVSPDNAISAINHKCAINIKTDILLR